MSPLLFGTLAKKLFKGSIIRNDVCHTIIPFEQEHLGHGQEITITLNNSSCGSLTSGCEKQVSVIVSHELNDNSIAG